MRRNGSAAPHNNWSPMVNAPRYCGPKASLRTRPTGICIVPVTATGEPVFSVPVAHAILGFPSASNPIAERRYYSPGLLVEEMAVPGAITLPSTTAS